jgi:regulator of ribonuclease activity A
MGFHTADLCDSGKENLQVLATGFWNYGGKAKMKGQIVTVKLNKNNQELAEMLKEPGEGRIVVVDVCAEYVAVVGENLMKRAQKNGWAGFVINGYIRDVEQTLDIGLGLWALGTCPRKAPDPVPGFLGHKLEFGGVEFEPGMYLYADKDGVIVSKEALV